MKLASDKETFVSFAVVSGIIDEMNRTLMSGLGAEV